MSSMITEVTERAVGASPGRYPATALSAVALVLLIALLVGKEMLRAQASVRSLYALRALNTMATPLLVAFAFVVLLRLLSIVYGG